MPILVSPGVAVVEKDFSSIVPSVSTSVGAFAGAFTWGPIEDPKLVSSETELVAKFGKPTDANYKSFFTAANFLAYTSALYIARASSDALNAVSTPSSGVKAADIRMLTNGTLYEADQEIAVTFSAPTIAGGQAATGTVITQDYIESTITYKRVIGITVTDAGYGYTSAPTITIDDPLTVGGETATAVVDKIDASGTLIKNATDFENTWSLGDIDYFGTIAAKYAGSKGNGVKVYVVDAGNYDSLPVAVQSKLTAKPGTSTYAAANVPAEFAANVNDEIHVIVLDNSKGSFSGVAGAVLEKYEFLSKMSDAKRTDGTSIYYRDVINASSPYIWALAHPADTTNNETDTVVVSSNDFTVNAAAGTITVEASAWFSQLAALAALVADAPAPGVQISLTDTTSNNGIYTVDTVDAILDVDDITVIGYTIITSSSLPSDESVVGGNIDVVLRGAWGKSSIGLEAIDGSATFDLLSTSGGAYTLAGGLDDDQDPSDAAVQTAYALFSSVDDYDISLIPTGHVSAATAGVVIDLAVSRMDCVAFVSPSNTTGNPWITSSQITDAVTAAKDFKDAVNRDTSYAVMDSGWKYQYDRYNDKYRWVPLNADTAGLCARTDLTADTWYSPGGFNRGQVKNIVKLGYNPTQAQRDELYKYGINPVTTFPGQGTILYGDKTMQSKPSAFDRVNVRRLFIVLEKAVARAAKFQLFEFNDTFTRGQFRNLVEPFLRDVQGRRGIIDFRVVCDETNNTGEVIDRNEFVADIYIKPNRSINFINLTFVAARSAVSFEEIGA